jgi:hypothetical protein
VWGSVSSLQDVLCLCEVTCPGASTPAGCEPEGACVKSWPVLSYCPCVSLNKVAKSMTLPSTS